MLSLWTSTCWKIAIKKDTCANKLAIKHFDKKYGEESDNYKEGKIEKFFDKRIFETGYDHSSGNIRLDKGVHPTKGIK